MPIFTLQGKSPELGEGTYVAPNAYAIGDVKIGDRSIILFAAILRGDLEQIVIGKDSNIQDNATLHTSDGKLPCIVEDQVTIGHGAILHSCRVSTGALVGMGAVVLDGAIIGEGALVGAKSLVSSGTVVPPGMLAYGSPAKVIRPLRTEEQEDISAIWQRYTRLRESYLAHST